MRHQLNETLPSLSSQGIEQLYTPPSTPSPSSQPSNIETQHIDRALILKRISKSLLLNFLELIGIMAKPEPGHAEEKIQDLRTMFINFHHLLNEYRPHQARESLILMMEEQLDRSKEETEGIERIKGKVERVLEGLGRAKLAYGDEKVAVEGEKHEREEGGAWGELVEEFE